MDRNPKHPQNKRIRMLSLSARRAWIEIFWNRRCQNNGSVALRKESVDRNLTPKSVFPTPTQSLSARRAWIEMYYYLWALAYCTSLFARRAWIEISDSRGTVHQFSVALRKESVDRNICLMLLFLIWAASLSARRAWIEIRHKCASF